MNILLFAGTTEGRLLAERLTGLPVEATIAVATEYGAEAMRGLPERFRILAGRMEAAAMAELMRRQRFSHVVDATHPYAAAASKNIREAAEAAGVPRLRLLRPASPMRDCEYADTVGDAAARLAGTSGNILLTTGSRDLAAYTVVDNYAERMYPRVLPTPEAVRRCRELGFRPKHVIAMHGPFSRELNRAVMKQFDLRVMVTKDGGAEGGFPEKMLAAEECGVRVFVVGRPPGDEGHDLEYVAALLKKCAEAEA